MTETIIARSTPTDTHSNEAVTLAEAGYRVFPVKPDAKRPPLLKDWPRRASADPAQVGAWWARRPRANVGIATGDGLVVIDIDPRNGGAAAALDALGLPPTLTASTPSGGSHHYYLTSGGEVRNSAGALAPGVDVRGERGYVLAPPSVVAGKGRYEWAEVRPLARIDAAVLRVPARRSEASGERARFEPRDEVAEGQRHDELVRWAGWLRSQGYEVDEIEKVLLEVNEGFRPPLPDRREVLGVAEWAAGRPS